MRGKTNGNLCTFCSKTEGRIFDFIRSFISFNKNIAVWIKNRFICREMERNEMNLFIGTLFN